MSAGKLLMRLQLRSRFFRPGSKQISGKSTNLCGCMAKEMHEHVNVPFRGNADYKLVQEQTSRQALNEAYDHLDSTSSECAQKSNEGVGGLPILGD